MKTEHQNLFWNRTYGISCKGPLKMLISAFLQVLSNFFPIFDNFHQLCQILSKCQVSGQLEPPKQKLQRKGTESALPQPYQFAKSQVCLGL